MNNVSEGKFKFFLSHIKANWRQITDGHWWYDHTHYTAVLSCALTCCGLCAVSESGVICHQWPAAGMGQDYPPPAAAALSSALIGWTDLRSAHKHEGWCMLPWLLTVSLPLHWRPPQQWWAELRLWGQTLSVCVLPLCDVNLQFWLRWQRITLPLHLSLQSHLTHLSPERKQKQFNLHPELFLF